MSPYTYWFAEEQGVGRTGRVSEGPGSHRRPPGPDGGPTQEVGRPGSVRRVSPGPVGPFLPSVLFCSPVLCMSYESQINVLTRPNSSPPKPYDWGETGPATLESGLNGTSSVPVRRRNGQRRRTVVDRNGPGRTDGVAGLHRSTLGTTRPRGRHRPCVSGRVRIKQGPAGSL